MEKLINTVGGTLCILSLIVLLVQASRNYQKAIDDKAYSELLKRCDPVEYERLRVSHEILHAWGLE